MIILLLYSRIEAIRQIGRSLLDDTTNRGVLRNVDALLRRNVETPAVGLMFTKSFQGHGTFCSARLTRQHIVQYLKCLQSCGLNFDTIVGLVRTLINSSREFECFP